MPYPPGAALAPGHSAWACDWATDRSAYGIQGLGCAGTTPRSQRKEDTQHASAEACEAWCCAATHMSVGPNVPGGWEASVAAAGAPCDIWQWMDLATADNGGCWVAPLGHPLTISAAPTAPGNWIGVEGCTRRPAWGAHFLLVLFLAVGVYVGGGWIHGTKVRGRRGREALPQYEMWLMVAGLVGDGIVRPIMFPSL